MSQGKREDPLAKPYVPIDTDLVDDLEHYASDQIHVQIEYTDRDGETRALRGFIADVFTTRDSEEFLLMMDGRCLRLDQVRDVHAKTIQARIDMRDRGLELEARLEIPDNRFFPNLNIR